MHEERPAILSFRLDPDDANGHDSPREARIEMKLITCVIRPDRLPAVKEALFQAGVTGITLTRASGHGGEQDNAALTPVTADEVRRKALDPVHA